MIKPAAIKRFEQCWWGSAAFSGLASLLSWDRVQNSIRIQLGNDPRLRTAESQEIANVVAGWAQWTGIAVVLLCTLLVWHLVARRASRVGKWLAVATAALSGLQLLILLAGLFMGRVLHPLSQGCSVAASVLAILATAFLFRDEARAWFGEFGTSDEELDA